MDMAIKLKPDFIVGALAVIGFGGGIYEFKDQIDRDNAIPLTPSQHALMEQAGVKPAAIAEAVHEDVDLYLQQAAIDETARHVGIAPTPPLLNGH
jgi:hypothetical protein